MSADRYTTITFCKMGKSRKSKLSRKSAKHGSFSGGAKKRKSNAGKPKARKSKGSRKSRSGSRKSRK